MSKNQHQPKRKSKRHKFGKLLKRPHFKRPIRKAVKEETAGGIVFRRRDGKVQFLVIRDAKKRWTIPKGHVEQGEKLEETARREVAEETGLTQVEVLDYLEKTTFQYRREDSLILMTQHNFLIKAADAKEKIKKEDWMTDIRWMDANEALEEIEYDSIGKLLLLSLKKIRNGQY